MQGVDKQVDFHIGLVPNSNERSVPTASVLVQQNSVANMERRTIKPQIKYGEVDLVAYAMSVAENIESNEELSTFEETVSCNYSSKWMIAM